MTLGQKIKKLRTDKGLTQKDLADIVHVTFQTVSKWEKDENEPDVATLRLLAKLFECSVDYLINEDEIEPKKEEVDVVVTPPTPTEVKEVTKEVIVREIVHDKELHICAKCGKDIPEEELVAEDMHRHVRVGRHTRTVSTGQTFYHKKCLDLVKRERAAEEARKRNAKASKSAKLSFGWGIAGGVIAFTIALLIFLLNPEVNVLVHPALAVLYSLLIGYAIFAMLYCIISGSYIGEVFVWCASLSIKFPGIIFSWDLDGLAFLIVMKILFAIIGFLIGVFALLFAIVLSALLGTVSFPFVLIHNIHTDYGDAL